MTGSIACAKACQVISRLVQAGHDVQVVATPSALKFVGVATLEGLSGRKVLSDLFESGEMMGHIHWARWADLILVAPATAHFINRIAHGLGEDLAANIFLAHDFKRPFLLSPAMNTSMYLHPMTQNSIRTLQAIGVQVLETASGVLACGEMGYGKLLDPDKILEEVFLRIQTGQALTTSLGRATSLERTTTLGQIEPLPNILITAGGTNEPIDDVRVISNRSTGSTGFELSQRFAEFGLPVTLLLSGQSVHAKTPVDFPVHLFSDFASLDNLLCEELKKPHYTHVFHLAAVSDFSLESIIKTDQSPTDENLSSGKLSSMAPILLKLRPNPKLVDKIKGIAANKGIKLVSFKLTSSPDAQIQQTAVAKLMKDSQSDYVVHNDWQQIKANPQHHLFSIYKASSPSSTHPAEQSEFVADSAKALAQYFIQEFL